MSFERKLACVVMSALCVLLASCLEQYDPSKNNAKFAAEWKQSVHPEAKLSETGELPPAGGPVVVVNAEERFSTICANCHGAKGYGDGPGGAALNPKPRNFHDKNWQASVNDQHIYDVIAKGGGAMGLSASMAPWSSILSPEEITALVKKIRVFGQE